MRIEDLYETNLDLTLRLQTLQPPVPLDNLASGTSSIPSDPLSPSNPVREPDACLESRDTGHVTTRDNAMATNEYSAEPGLPNNVTIAMDSELNVNRHSMLADARPPSSSFSSIWFYADYL